MSSHQAPLPLVCPIEYGRMLTNPQQSGTAPIIVHTANGSTSPPYDLDQAGHAVSLLKHCGPAIATATTSFSIQK